MRLSSIRHLTPFILVPILALTFFIYSQGLSGGFIFDDYANINRLSEYNVFNSFDDFLNYIRVPRAISFLSFLIDDHSWPTTAYSFIYTNILLHLICGCLLAWLSYKIALILECSSNRAEIIALLSCFLWLSHPLFVSTTLYVVQRMTILASLFTIASLLCYLIARQGISLNKSKSYYILFLGSAFFALLSFFSKQTAVLIPCYLFLFENILFRKQKIKTSLFKVWSYLYIYIPIIVLSILLFYMAFSELYLVRNFTVYERLLTEARVLFNYIYLLLIPQTDTYGLHYENYLISQNFLTPWNTPFAIMSLILILIFTWKARIQYPVISLAILFFFTGHLIESTTIGLEIYFEHRNYLPSILFFFCAAYYLVSYFDKHKKLIAFMVTLLLLLYPLITFSRANLWGSPLQLMYTWTKNNPYSARNYQEGMMIARREKNLAMEIHFLNKGLEVLPENISLLTQKIIMDCNKKQLNHKSVEQLKLVLLNTTELKTRYVFTNLNKLLKSSPECSILSYKNMDILLGNALLNPYVIINPIRQHELYYLKGLLAKQNKNYQQAYDYFNESVTKNPLYNYILMQSILLANAKQLQLALQHLIQSKKILSAKNKDFSLTSNKMHNLNELENKLIFQLSLESKNKNNSIK